VYQNISVTLRQWFPITGRDPNLGRGGTDAGSQEGFMELDNYEKIKICA